MLEIFHNPAYDFIGKRRLAYAVSVAVMVLGLGSMFVKGGLQYDIDFTGGTLLEVRLAQPASTGAIRSRLTAAGLGDSVIQIFDDPRDVLIRTHGTHPDPTELSRRIIGALATNGTSAPEIRRLESVGPQIGDELRKQAVYAVLAALLGILLYIWMPSPRMRRQPKSCWRRCTIAGHGSWCWGLTDTIYCAISSLPRSRARFFALARSRCSLAPESPRG